LDARGFTQYEVSAFARAGRQCRHNLNYWRFGDYLGLGAGAHGKLTHAGIERSTHLREPRRYLASAAQGPAWKPVPEADLPFEFAMNALRLNQGFEENLFVARTGLPFSRLEDRVRSLQDLGLMEFEPASGRWRATVRGRQLLNEVVQRFLPGRNSEAVAGS
jgi:coproporphyrinogen III oxidase-like Fe-S oxidoreductase